MDDRGLGVWRRLAVVLVLMLAGGAAAQADPPLRIGRIAALDGDVRLFDAATQQWLAATRNRPFAQGERLAVGSGASAELQVGGTALLLDADTEIAAPRLDDDKLEFFLVRGSAGLRVHEGELASQLDVVTAEAVFRPLRSGLYRVDRSPQGSSGSAWRGLLRATAGGQVLVVEPGQRVAFDAGGAAAAVQARWSTVYRDAFSELLLREPGASAPTAAVLPAEVTGAAELERHGSWQQHPSFGWAWSPTVVPPQWAPYRFGQWVWVQPWGWTWVDAAPWGFAPYRHGEWFWWGTRWAWAPGPGRPRPVVVPVSPVVPVPPGAIVGGRPPPPLGWNPPPPQGWQPIRPPTVPPREPLLRPVTPPVPVTAPPAGRNVLPGAAPPAPALKAVPLATPPAPIRVPAQAAPMPAAPRAQAEPRYRPFHPEPDAAMRSRPPGQPAAPAPGRER